MDNSSNSRVVIIVALIGLLGVVITAISSRVSGELAAVEAAIHATMTAEERIPGLLTDEMDDLLGTPFLLHTPTIPGSGIAQKPLQSTDTPKLEPSTDTPQPEPTETPTPRSTATRTPIPTVTKAARPTATKTATPPPNVTRTAAGWHPAPGYEWVNSSYLTVIWKPGVRHPDYRHIYSANEEGYWSADPGYDWVSLGNSLFVIWKSGLPHPDFPNIFSADKEGYWNAAPGYNWVNPGNSLAVVWTPGMQHSQYPHVIADEGERKWLAAPGYIWAYPDDNSNFEVVPKGSDSTSSGTRDIPASAASNEGCFLFQNQYTDEVTITFTRKVGNWTTTFKLPKGSELQECFPTGEYTYTLGAPGGSANSERTVYPGDNGYFPIRPGK